MHYRVYKDVFSKDVIKNIKDYFEQQEKKHLTNGMLKIEQPWKLDVVQEYIKPVLSNYFNVNLENIGDNIYKHSSAYFPHVDIANAGYPCFNVLIPILVKDNVDQKFCIFDQYVNDYTSGATWLGKAYNAVKDFEHNKKRRFIFNDSIVENKTNKEIDTALWQEHLEGPARDKNMFKQCSVNVVDYAPGNLIIFDSKYIHCTGKMKCEWKMGLSLRFKGNFEKEIL
jgi:hypothetical protein|tara:strand:- start:18252 stop:18929 length:678 start_codon:yes stop_codon:yes gene_type:complete